MTRLDLSPEERSAEAWAQMVAEMRARIEAWGHEFVGDASTDREFVVEWRWKGQKRNVSFRGETKAKAWERMRELFPEAQPLTLLDASQRYVAIRDQMVADEAEASKLEETIKELQRTASSLRERSQGRGYALHHAEEWLRIAALEAAKR